jgi:CheY-like chemotaxis protein
MKGDKERCLASGMDGYVSKPIKLEELFSVIEKVLHGTTHDPGTKDLTSQRMEMPIVK